MAQYNEKAKLAADSLINKKAYDVMIINVGDKTIISDYFVIATGNSNIHVNSLADDLENAMAKEGIIPLRKEGIGEGRWAVIDYGDVLVHIFHKDERKFYNIERLWVEGDNYIKIEE